MPFRMETFQSSWVSQRCTGLRGLSLCQSPSASQVDGPCDKSDTSEDTHFRHHGIKSPCHGHSQPPRPNRSQLPARALRQHVPRGPSVRPTVCRSAEASCQRQLGLPDPRHEPLEGTDREIPAREVRMGPPSTEALIGGIDDET